jgi:hypothetical protein
MPNGGSCSLSVASGDRIARRNTERCNGWTWIGHAIASASPAPRRHIWRRAGCVGCRSSRSCATTLRKRLSKRPRGGYVINRYRHGNQNLRTQLNRILRRAGVEPWPKLFHNLRASRKTELAATFPIHVVGAWIGNTERIAAKPYLQVTEDYFHRAGGAECGAQTAKTAQNQAQQAAAPARTQTQKPPTNPGGFANSSGFSEVNQYPQGDSNPCLSRERAMS